MSHPIVDTEPHSSFLRHLGQSNSAASPKTSLQTLLSHFKRNTETNSEGQHEEFRGRPCTG